MCVPNIDVSLSFEYKCPPTVGTHGLERIHSPVKRGATIDVFRYLPDDERLVNRNGARSTRYMPHSLESSSGMSSAGSEPASASEVEPSHTHNIESDSSPISCSHSSHISCFSQSKLYGKHVISHVNH